MSLLQAISPGSRRSSLSACEVANPPCPELGVRRVRFTRPPGIVESRWLCEEHARFVEAATGATPSTSSPASTPSVTPNPTNERASGTDGERWRRGGGTSAVTSRRQEPPKPVTPEEPPMPCRFPGCKDPSPPTVRGLHKGCYTRATRMGVLEHVALPRKRAGRRTAQGGEVRGA